MPIYSYKCNCGQRQTVVKPMSEATLPVLCDKCAFVMHRDYKADFGKQHFGDIWPHASYAAGVHHKQIPEMMEFDKKHGVPTEYTEDGDPIHTSRSHRRKYHEAHGIFDRSAGYSDALPARCR